MSLVILDRDGVINLDSDAYIKSPEEWQPVTGSPEAIAALTRAEYRVVVATNQSFIARKLFDEYTLARIHQKMAQTLERACSMIHGVFYCPHGPGEGCSCRKPETGLLEAISREFDHPLEGVPLVGDSWKDVQAARRAGCVPYLVRTGKGERTLAEVNAEELAGVHIVADLSEAVKKILGDTPV